MADWHGDKISEVRYTPWGEVRWAWELDGEAYTNRLYTSQLAQNRNYVGQLYDYGARFYSPLLGRFNSADCIVPDPKDPQSLNHYSYVRNHPLTRVDPNGHEDKEPPLLGPYGGNYPLAYDNDPSYVEAYLRTYNKLGADVAKEIINYAFDAGNYQSDVGKNSVRELHTRAIGEDERAKVLRAANMAELLVQDPTNLSPHSPSPRPMLGDFSEAERLAQGTTHPAILPGLFKYQQSDSLAKYGYQQHHLWPQALGGPKEGWTIYAYQHTKTGEIQNRLNRFLMDKFPNENLTTINQWARGDVEGTLNLLREFYQKEGIDFPY